MLTIGLSMLAAAVAMVAVARPQNGTVVPWLQSESRQQLYGTVLLILMTLGGLLAAGS